MSDQLMNTKEVAEYLGIHEKQVYALIKAKGIPCTRATGKWIFPKHLIDAWLEKEARENAGSLERGMGADRDVLLSAGSNDPILDVLLSRMGQEHPELHVFHNNTGSLGGLAMLKEDLADIVWCHLYDTETGEYNIPYIKEQLPGKKIAMVHLFYRELGLILSRDSASEVKGIADLKHKGIRLINRQPGAGTRVFLDQQLKAAGIDSGAIEGYENEVNTHMEVGLAVMSGTADAGLGTVSAARMFNLPFVPLIKESFDMVLLQETFFKPAIQAFIDTVNSEETRDSVMVLGNYDFSESGKIIYSSK